MGQLKDGSPLYFGVYFRSVNFFPVLCRERGGEDVGVCEWVSECMRRGGTRKDLSPLRVFMTRVYRTPSRVVAIRPSPTPGSVTTVPTTVSGLRVGVS